MKALYLDCGMGAAGDMLTAALLELLPNADEFVSELNALNIPDVQFINEKSVKCGITGTHMTVKVQGVEEDEDMHGHEHGHLHDNHSRTHQHEHDGHEHTNDHKHHHRHDHSHERAHCHDTAHHHHSGMHDIEHIISELPLSQKVKHDILAVYSLIAEAESHVHGKPVTEIHFHEVGTMDAIADVTAVCMLIDRLGVDEIIVSPVHVGCGQIKCAHGILPVPAPATAHILRDVPIYGGGIDGELCTPTGAALLKHFATRFGNMPAMKTKAIGYGMGKKDFPRANCVRAMLGETVESINAGNVSSETAYNAKVSITPEANDTILELSCNVDDMTAETIAFAMERLFEAGANDVYTVPIVMKKSRPGTLISVMCREENKESILKTIFKYTSTIGVREAVMHRYILDRDIETLHTPHGDVRRKISSGYGVSRYKYEYDDLARIATERNLSLDEVKKIVEEGLK